jgi:lipopolysaccharide export system permease protein
VFGTLLNRLIFWELVKVFLMSLGTLTGLLVTAGLLQQANQMGLSLRQVINAIPLFIPNTLPYTIPATTLFASCVVYGRISHDNEVVAIKGAGVHLANILKPAFVLGAITTVVTAALSHTVIPVSQQMLYRQLTSDPEEVLYNQLRRDHCLRNPNLPYVIYVKDVQGKRLIDMVMKERRKGIDHITGKDIFIPGYKMVARAREAKLRVEIVDGSPNLYLDPVRCVMYNDTTSVTTPATGPMKLELPEGLTGKDKIRISAMPWNELSPNISEIQAKVDIEEEKRDKNRKIADQIKNAEQKQIVYNNDMHFKYMIDIYHRAIRNIEAEFYLRPALSVGCLVFALLGCPVGIWANRADYLSTFVICFLPTLFIYYPLLLAGSGLGKDERLPLGLGCWMPDIVIGGVAVFLNMRLLRR